MTKAKNTSKIIIRYLLLVTVCVTIFWFSSNNGEDSTSQSNFIVNKITGIFFPSFYSYDVNARLALHDILTVFVRKGAHFAVYTLLGMLGYASFFQIKKLWLRYGCAVGFVFLYACTDEIHQMFVSERTAKISDICIDTIGGLLGALIIMFFIVFIKAVKIVEKSNKENPDT